MSQRISVLVALDGADEGLKRAITSAERSLGELASSARTAGEKAAAGMAQVQAGMSAFGDQVNRAKTQLLAFLSINWAAGKVQEIVAIADAWNMMSARLKLATAGQREYTVAQQALSDIAQRIGVPIQETATLYGKLQQAVRMLGGEQQDALTVTESISQALRLSGASAAEAQSSLLQFGQALATSQTNEAKRAEDAKKQSEQNQTQVVQLEAQSREAYRKQEYASAEQLMRQAETLRAEITQKSTAADQAAVQSKNEVAGAIGAIRTSEELLNKTLDAESTAHQKAAQSAITARDQIGQTLTQTETQIDQITTKLKDGLKVTIDADKTRFDQAITELDQALSEKAFLLKVQADLQEAEKKLQEYEQLLKAGKTLPVDADVSQAKAALEQLKTYADQHSQVELQVATEKAQAAINNVDGMIRALSRIQTESRHQVNTNVEAARSEIMSLNGANTSSTHTIYVQRVEANAAGGLVGGLRHFAEGGAVESAFPRMSSGSVPGSGHQDTVPRTLDAGAFVIRKAVVQKIGAQVLGRLSGATPKAGSALPRSDTVPAMLTPGEFVVRRETVARYGSGFFEALNQMKLPAQALASRLLPGLRGFASGGLVPPAMGALNLSLTKAMTPPVPRTDGAPVRTIRVELVAGDRSVSAAIDERDEAGLLQLLNAARARVA